MFTLVALLALITALAYLATASVSGFAAIPLVCGIVWLLFAGGLKAGMRWVSYLAFLLAIAGAITVYATSLSSALPVWATAAFIAVQCALIVLLFVLIWRTPAPTAVASDK